MVGLWRNEVFNYTNFGTKQFLNTLESLLLWLVNPSCFFSFQPYTPTIEDTYVGLVETDRGTKEKLRFYDTAGLDVRNRFLPPHYHAVADGYIIVYSVTDNLSFQLLIDIKKDIDKNKDKKDVCFFIYFKLIYSIIYLNYDLVTASQKSLHRSEVFRNSICVTLLLPRTLGLVLDCGHCAILPWCLLH